MRILSAYYSRTGNTAAFAKAITEELSSRGARVDEVRVSTAGRMSFVACGFQALMRTRPAILPPTLDASGYDAVLLGFPVWAGRPASPFNSIVTGLVNARGQRFGLFTTCAMTSGYRSSIDLAAKDIEQVGGVVLCTVGLPQRHTPEMATIAANYASSLMQALGREVHLP